jgi:hypothetical protein
MNLLTSFSLNLKAHFNKNNFSESTIRLALNIFNINIPRHSRKNLLTVAVAGVAAATAFAATPASAAFFRFCGIFLFDRGTIDGIIQLDDLTGEFISIQDAITTDLVDLGPPPVYGNPIIYECFLGRSVEFPDPGEPFDNQFPVFRYTFTTRPSLYQSCHPFPTSNILNVNIPLSWFPINFPAIGDPPINIFNTEIRNGITRKDPDKLRQIPPPPPAPGPLPIFGAAAAFGFSRNFRKRIKSTSS